MTTTTTAIVIAVTAMATSPSLCMCHESTANEAFNKNKTMLFVNVSNGDV